MKTPDNNRVAVIPGVVGREGGKIRLPFRAAALVLGLSGLLIGCERSESPSRSGERLLEEATGTPKESDSAEMTESLVRGSDPTLSILTWGDYLVPELLEKFEDIHSISLVVTEAGNSGQLMQTLASHPDRFDVVIADDKSMTELIALRLLSEIDMSRIKGIGNIDAAFKGLYFDPANEFSVPYLWGMTVLASRSERVPPGDLSWTLLWQPELKGRVAILDEPEDMFFIALLSMGISPRQATASQIEAAQKLLGASFIEMHSRMRDFYSALDGLESDQHDLVVTYSGDAFARSAANRDLGVTIPKEGAPLWLDSFAISRDAASSDLAHKFVDFMISKEAAATTANLLTHSSPNAAARPLISPELLRDPVLYPPPEVMDRCQFIAYSPESRTLVRQGVRRLFDTIRKEGIDPEEWGVQSVTQVPGVGAADDPGTPGSIPTTAR